MPRAARAVSPGASPSARPAAPGRGPAAPAPARGSAPPTRARPRRPSGSPPLSRAPLAQLLELLPRARVADVGLREPASPRLRHGQLDVCLGTHLVRIGGDEELQTCLLSGSRVHVSQVEPVGLAVGLQERACRK